MFKSLALPSRLRGQFSRPRGLSKRALLAAGVTLALTGSASAQSFWTGGSGNWSDSIAPGWTTGGVPNAVGATATIDNITANTVITQNIGAGVTVGTLSFAPTVASDFSETITLTNAITFNQDGAGAGFATISNANASATTGNALILSAGTINLADNLLISNTGASTNTTGAIQIIGTIAGAGNLTFANNSTALTQAGSIRLQTATNTFTGAVRIRQGTTTYNTAGAFGATANTITIGESGFGTAALLQTTQVNVPNPIVVATGATGTLYLGSLSTAAGVAYSGTINLAAPLTIYGSGTIGSNSNQYSGAVSGAGALTISGPGSSSFITAEPRSRAANSGSKLPVAPALARLPSAIPRVRPRRRYAPCHQRRQRMPTTLLSPAAAPAPRALTTGMVLAQHSAARSR
jgi:fibronectin-binding autotransporter adhesin